MGRRRGSTRWKGPPSYLWKSPSPNLTLTSTSLRVFTRLLSSFGGEICFSGVRLFARGMIASLSARGAIRHVRTIARQTIARVCSCQIFSNYFQNTIRLLRVGFLASEGEASRRETEVSMRHTLDEISLNWNYYSTKWRLARIGTVELHPLFPLDIIDNLI